GQLRDSFSIEYEVPLFQVLSPIVNAAIFGEEHVFTTDATEAHGNRMKVLINNKLPKRCSLVLDSVYEDKMIRQVATIAQKSGIGEVRLVHNEPMTFTPTFKVLRNTDGN